MKISVILMTFVISMSGGGQRVVGRRTSVPVYRVREWTQNDLLTAHIMLEGGESGRVIHGWNYNSMGIKATGSSNYMLLKTTECFRGECKRVHQRFRSFSSFENAMKYYMGMMSQNFPKSLECAKKEDVRCFSIALKSEGYYTKSVAGYRAGLERKMEKLNED